MDRMIRQLRDATRQLRNAPLFTLTAVASLAIGIGANTAVFTVANGLFLAPTAGIRDQSRLVDIGRSDDGRGFDTVSFPTYLDVRDRVDLFEGVYATRFEPAAMSLGGRDGAERIYGELVSASYFDVLGLTPSAGTFFRTREEQLGVPLRKVVLSHAFWTRRFAADPAIVGSTVVLNGDTFDVTGVGPVGFHGTTILMPDVWVPLTAYARAMPNDDVLRGRQNNGFLMAARLKPGVSIAQARDGCGALMRRLTEAYPETYRRRGFVVSAASRIPGLGSEFVLPFLSLLMALVGLVLLVACTNLAGLLLARAAARSREVAVRLALGASRGAVFGMLITESLVLFALGAVAACGVAYGMTRVLLSVIPTLPAQVNLDLPLDWRVLGFTALLTLVTGTLTGAAPAFQSARANLVPDLKAAGSGRRRQRLRHAFIAAQMALCLVLIVLAGLFIRALTTATHIDAGMAVDRIDVASIDLALGGYAAERAPAVAEDIRARLAAVPGVAAVGIARMVPLDGGGLGLGGLRRPGATSADARIDTDWNVISPEFLETVRLPILKGRNFTAADREGAPLAAIVNAHLASAEWPGQDPIGQVLENGDFRPGRERTIQRLTVVGVAQDAKYRWVGEAPRHFIYVPLAQQPMSDLQFFVRRADGLSAEVSLQPAVRKALADFDRDLPLVRMAPLRQFADLGLLPQRLAASLAGAMGGIALLLGAIGIYGVTAFAVASRTREIGLRMALGADAARVTRWVLWQGVRLTAIGGGVGLLVALAVTRLVSSLLFGVSPIDPIAFGTTIATLVGVTLAAGWLPARRASRTDPMQALRAD
jgi:predicted permease